MKRRPPLTPEQREFIRTSGASVSQLAARLNADPSVISRARSKMAPRPKEREPLHRCYLHGFYPCPAGKEICAGLKTFQTSAECPKCAEAGAAFAKRRWGRTWPAEKSGA